MAMKCTPFRSLRSRAPLPANEPKASQIVRALRSMRAGCPRSRLSLAVRDLLGFRQTPQPQHRYHAEQRTDRENREGVSPAHEIFKVRNQFNGNCRQQESKRSLNRQRGADVLRITKLSDAG